jgi:hypothetical protein
MAHSNERVVNDRATKSIAVAVATLLVALLAVVLFLM